MYKPAIQTGVFFAMLAVIFGAFGAHYLKTIFTPELISSFETGVRYQIYHAFALLFIGLYAKYNTSSLIKPAFFCMLFGILLFSGSIYLLCFLKSTNTLGLSGIGILTPLGGLCFIGGWVLLLVSSLRNDSFKTS